MKTALISFFLLLTINEIQTDQETIYYISLNKSIHAGQLDGAGIVRDAKVFGNFGLGSEARLNSEFVMIDGIAYGVPANGRASKMRDEDSLAFAAVTSFEQDTTFVIRNIENVDQLSSVLNATINTNRFCAIKISGTFESVNLRSFQKQNKPYKPVDAVPEVKYTREKLQGVMIGFFTPKSALVLNSPNYHFHFIDDKRSTGGHLLDCHFLSCRVEIDYANALSVILPAPRTMKHVDLNKDN